MRLIFKYLFERKRKTDSQRERAPIGWFTPQIFVALETGWTEPNPGARTQSSSPVWVAGSWLPAPSLAVSYGLH